MTPTVAAPAAVAAVAPGGQVCSSVAGTAVLDQWCSHNCRNGFCPTDRCACVVSEQGEPAQALGGAALSFAKAPDAPVAAATVGAGCRSVSRTNALVDAVADKWCYDNCAIGFCPEDKCECDAATKAATTDATPLMVLPVAPTEAEAASPLASTTKAATSEAAAAEADAAATSAEAEAAEAAAKAAIEEASAAAAAAAAADPNAIAAAEAADEVIAVADEDAVADALAPDEDPDAPDAPVLPEAPLVPGTPGYKEATLEGPAYPTPPEVPAAPAVGVVPAVPQISPAAVPAVPVAVAGLPDAPVVPGTPGYQETKLEGPAVPAMPASVSAPNLDPPPMPDALKNPFAAGEAAAALAPAAAAPQAMPLSVSSPAEAAKAVADQHAADAAKALAAAKAAMEEASQFAADAAKAVDEQKANGGATPSPAPTWNKAASESASDAAEVGNVMVAANDAARKALEAGIKATRREGLKSAAGYIKAAEDAKAKAEEAQAATAEATQAAQAATEILTEGAVQAAAKAAKASSFSDELAKANDAAFKELNEKNSAAAEAAMDELSVDPTNMDAEARHAAHHSRNSSKRGNSTQGQQDVAVVVLKGKPRHQGSGHNNSKSGGSSKTRSHHYGAEVPEPEDDTSGVSLLRNGSVHYGKVAKKEAEANKEHTHLNGTTHINGTTLHNAKAHNGTVVHHVSNASSAHHNSSKAEVKEAKEARAAADAKEAAAEERNMKAREHKKAAEAKAEKQLAEAKLETAHAETEALKAAAEEAKARAEIKQAERAEAEAEAATAEAKIRAQKAEAEAAAAAEERQRAEVSRAKVDAAAAQTAAAEQANSDLARHFKEKMQLKKKSRDEALEARKQPRPASSAGPLAGQRCRATTSSNHNLDAWCDSNCKVGFCPEDKCMCETPAEELAVEDATAEDDADVDAADDAAVSEAIAAADAATAAADAAEAAATAAENALLPQGLPAPEAPPAPTSDGPEPTPEPPCTENPGLCGPTNGTGASQQPQQELTDQALMDIVTKAEAEPSPAPAEASPAPEVGDVLAAKAAPASTDAPEPTPEPPCTENPGLCGPTTDSTKPEGSAPQGESPQGASPGGTSPGGEAPQGFELKAAASTQTSVADAALRITDAGFEAPPSRLEAAPAVLGDEDGHSNWKVVTPLDAAPPAADVPAAAAAVPVPVPVPVPVLPVVPVVPVATTIPVPVVPAVPAVPVVPAVPAAAPAVAPTAVTPLPFYVDAAAAAAAQAAAAVMPLAAPQVPVVEAAVVPAPVDLNYSPQKLPFEHAIIGYWGTGANTPFEYMEGKSMEGPTVADALVKGYNVINVAYADQFTVNGSFQLHTDMCPEYNDTPDRAHECAQHKDTVSRAANTTSASWRYLLSFGGKNGAAPYMSALLKAEERAAQEQVFADGFLARYAELKAKYGFDGIDLSVESGLATPLLSAFRTVFKTLHAQGEIVSLAPETPSLNPAEMDSFFEGSFNSYAPLVDTSIIDSVSWVAPRLYNDALPQRSNVSKYVSSLREGRELEWDGRQIKIDIPPSKLVLGHPASAEAAPARELDSWQKDPNALVDHYRSSPELLATAGVMAWSIGHDYGSGWKWVTAAKQIWQ